MVEEGQSQLKISPELIKFQEIAENVEEDRLSALPENLLLEILIRLPYTEDAIRTGILCKRWKHLWTLVPTLDFKLFNYIRPLSDFVSFIDKTLTQCRQLKLKKLKLITLYDDEFEPQFNNWIRFAINCNVEELILQLFSKNYQAKFVLDQIFFVSLSFTVLRLSGFISYPTGCAISWNNLRRLCITYGKLDEGFIEDILCGSPVLETLELVDCTGYKLLNITSKSVMNLILCGYRNSKAEYDEVRDVIKISAPNILSLTIEGDLKMWKLLLLNVSSLVEANLDYELYNYLNPIPKEVKEETLKGLIVSLRHVRELKIGVSCSEVVSRLEDKGFTFPSNIKYPDVTYDWPDSDSVENKEL